MAESTIWWLLTGGAVAVELLTGTFYLLMLALGLAAAAVVAHLGASLVMQLVVAALVGGGAVVFWHVRQGKMGAELPAQANPNVNMDIGEVLQVNVWKADGTADVQYRGAHWTAIHRTGITPSTGLHRVSEIIGNRLLLDKT
ncbi:MAG: NfeD family protein [Burkholderiales bacterium]|nr:NfeD family protein [Burkholderiales bacterium]